MKYRVIKEHMTVTGIIELLHILRQPVVSKVLRLDLIHNLFSIHMIRHNSQIKLNSARRGEVHNLLQVLNRLIGRRQNSILINPRYRRRSHVKIRRKSLEVLIVVLQVLKIPILQRVIPVMISGKAREILVPNLLFPIEAQPHNLHLVQPKSEAIQRLRQIFICVFMILLKRSRRKEIQHYYLGLLIFAKLFQVIVRNPQWLLR